MNGTMNLKTTRFNTFDEALIQGDLETVYQTMIQAVSGHGGWWNALWEAEIVGDKPITKVGGRVKITVHSFFDVQFYARTVAIKDLERLHVEFYAGDFLGYGIWLWEAKGNKTRISQEWHASPNSLKFYLASKLIDIEMMHSKIIHKAFNTFNQYLCASNERRVD